MVYSNIHVSQKEISEIANLHLISLETSMITFLGKRITEKYYDYVIKSNHEYLFILKEDDTILGACVLSKDSELVMRRFIMNYWPILSIKVLKKFLLSADDRKKIIKFLLVKPSLPKEIYGLPEVVQIFTNPNLRNKKIGTRLLQQVEDFLQTKNITEYYLKTLGESDNEAIYFYKKRGFVEIGTSVVGNKTYLYYLKTLSR